MHQEFSKTEIMEYLRNVGLVEYTLYQEKKRIEELENEIKLLGMKRQYESKLAPFEGFRLLNGVKYLFQSLLLGLGLSIIITIVWLVGEVVNIAIDWDKLVTVMDRVFAFTGSLPRKLLISGAEKPLASVEELMSFEDIAVNFACSTIGITIYILLLLLLISAVRIGVYQYRAYLDRKDEGKFNNDEVLRLGENESKKAELRAKQEQIARSMEKLRDIRQELYEVNLLHTRYRNMLAVFALFEFLNTASAETINDAINEYNASDLQMILDTQDEIYRTMRENVMSFMASGNAIPVKRQGEPLQSVHDTSCLVMHALFEDHLPVQVEV